MNMKKTILLSGAAALLASSVAMASTLNVQQKIHANPSAIKVAEDQASCNASCNESCNAGNCNPSCNANNCSPCGSH